MSKLIINADLGTQLISRHLYGHFAEHLGRCIYDGLWVGEESPIPNTRGWRNDLIDALKAIGIPNLRWPGGCFADTYHWKDGIGPKRDRPGIVNVHWGGVTETNQVGTHEFLDLCEILNADAYVAGNVGSGTVREMAEWLEYMTMPGDSPMSRLRRQNGRDKPWSISFFGIGNENWGCGGDMRPQYYADLYRHYATYCRHYTPGRKLYKVACGLNDEWTDLLMREAGSHFDGLSVHYYTWPGSWGALGSATQFDVDDWKLTLQKAANIEPFIRSTAAIMDRYDPARRVGIVMDEWGAWYESEPGSTPGFLYQQNTLRDALVAGVSLNIFNNHADRVRVANLAQVVNVLQAVALTEGEKLVLTPTYHVFEMYRPHHDATLLPTTLTSDEYVPARTLGGNPGAPGLSTSMQPLPQVSVSASKAASGHILLTLCNLHHEEDDEIECVIRGATPTKADARLLTGRTINALNRFDHAAEVAPVAFDGVVVADGGCSIRLPARSVLAVRLS
jgi:alpha-L-arabinofuranosidase